MGIKFGSNAIDKLYFSDSEVSKVYLGSDVVYENAYNGYLRITNIANSTQEIAFAVYGSLSTMPTLYYKIDNGNWTEYDWNGVVLNAGSKCYWKGDNSTFSTNAINYVYFLSDYVVQCDGNIMSLLDSTMQSTTIPSNYCFINLFKNSKITTAPNLPATALTTGCYQYMFYGCTYLTKAPIISATGTIPSNALNSLFRGCTSLVYMPKLSGTLTLNSNSMNQMFYGCTSLYVSDTQTSSAQNSWSLTYIFSGLGTQSSVFTSCLGTRSSDNIATASSTTTLTYYTQNQPVE